jgi:hypothetical protein
MNDRELQAAYGEILRDRATGRRACPAPEAIRALIEREGTEVDRLATLDHVMNCDTCKAEFDLMQAVAAGKPMPVRRFPIPLAAAATVALLLSGTLLFLALRARVARQDGLRGGIAAVDLLSPRGDASGRPVTFIWRSAPKAARYTLEVFNADGDPIYTTEGDDTAAVLPASIPFVVGETYHWWVLVRTSEGAEARTQPVNFKP